MKTKALSVLTGVATSMILSATADAGFDGIKVIAKPIPSNPLYQPGFPGPLGGFVCNVFATFNRPGADRFVAGAGTPDSPMDIHVVGGTFYQNPFGTDTAPNGALLAFFPSLAFDSFVTIGAKAIGPGFQNPPPLLMTPGWPGFGPSFFGGNNLGWANTPLDPNTDPFNPAFYLGNGQVLIGQFTTLNGTGIVGMLRILVISNNVGTQLDVSFSHFVPAPGALALLGAAGLVGRRRRRGA